MLDLLTDQNFLSALATMIGPLAFFAAPTGEIEHLLYGEYVSARAELEGEPDLVPVCVSVAEAA